MAQPWAPCSGSPTVLQEQGVQIQFKLKISYVVFCAANSQNKGNAFKSP